MTVRAPQRAQCGWVRCHVTIAVAYATRPASWGDRRAAASRRPVPPSSAATANSAAPLASTPSSTASSLSTGSKAGRSPFSQGPSRPTTIARDAGSARRSRSQRSSVRRSAARSSRAPAKVFVTATQQTLPAQISEHRENAAVVVVRLRQPELAEDAGDVLLDRAFGNDELARDPGVAAALGHQPEHL